ncbi:MAG TPA: family 16 glycoside hydrolase, partial [Blastocatellia bacterium]|nr:family 16 glycoside hydrolase [Blastocatellia bacterium]
SREEGTMRIDWIRGRRLAVLCAIVLAGMYLALSFGAVTSAQTTLFSDNFQDGNANGWSRSNGTWTVVTDGTLVFRQSSTTTDARARAGLTSWTDYSVQARVKPIAFGSAGRYVALITRAENSNHFYQLALQNGNQLVLARRVGDTVTTLASRSFTVTTNTFFTLRIDAQGSSLRAFVNGTQQLTATDSTFPAGAIGVGTFFASGSFDDVVVTSLSGQQQNPPPAPTGLTASAGNGQVALSWNASAGATSYNVKRSTTSGGPYTLIAGVTSTSFTNTGLTNGTTFFYVVSALNSAGESPNSNEASARPIANQFTLVTNIVGSGTVARNPNASSYNSGTVVTLTATAGAGFQFSGWSGDLTGNANPATITMNSNKTVTATFTSVGGTPDFRLIGFAAGVTTGGKGGTLVTVSSLAALQSAAAATSAMVIQISGRITGSDIVRVASNKTIVGIGSTGELVGIELGLADSSNIIIRNLKISKVQASNHDGDAIHLQDTHNVWIDHCELFNEDPAVQTDKDFYDGLVDITHDCSFVTVSWCYFHDSWKTSLIGSSDSDNFNRRVTFHHNLYRNVNSRVPSYRFGVGHVFNSYFVDVPTSGVNTRMGAVLRVEGNVFENVQDPITSLDSSAIGFWDVRDNQFINCTGSQPTTSTGTFNPPYSYSLDSSANVRNIVMQFAGVGRVDPLQGLP